jgi:hypothetical protein
MKDVRIKTKTKTQFDQIISVLSLIIDQYGENNLFHSSQGVLL